MLFEDENVVVDRLAAEGRDDLGSRVSLRELGAELLGILLRDGGAPYEDEDVAACGSELFGEPMKDGKVNTASSVIPRPSERRA